MKKDFVASCGKTWLTTSSPSTKWGAELQLGGGARAQVQFLRPSLPITGHPLQSAWAFIRLPLSTSPNLTQSTRASQLQPVHTTPWSLGVEFLIKWQTSGGQKFSSSPSCPCQPSLNPSTCSSQASQGLLKIWARAICCHISSRLGSLLTTYRSSVHHSAYRTDILWIS